MFILIFKGCYGYVCWGKFDIMGYGNGLIDLLGIYYSFDVFFYCFLFNILILFILYLSYNVYVLGYIWFNFFLFVLCIL